MAANAVGLPHIARKVDGVIELAYAEVGDECIDGVGTLGVACDSDDGDLVTVLPLYLCDRRGFSLAGRSPGSPEPEDDILAIEIAEVDLAAADGWGAEELFRQLGVRL